jgi:hypothetical protein
MACRTHELAQQSDIKAAAYTTSDVDSLFEGFQRQIDSCLLFLKSVRSAAVYTRGGGDEALRLLFRVTVNTQVEPDCASVRH